MSLKEGTIIGDKWVIGKVIGTGACGIVYDVKPCNSNKKTYDYSLVVKVIPLGKGLSKAKAKEQERLANTLFYEYQLYVGHISPFPFRPQLPDSFFGSDDNLGVRYLVMEKLDMDLIKYSKSKPSVSNIATIGLQLLDGLSWLHQKGFVFVDVKPDNFMLKNDKVYFVDYGLAEMASKNRNQNRSLVGTPSYCSLSVHNNNVNVYKDDIESMALVLISLALECKLPWADAKSDEEVKTKMEKCDVSLLASSYGMLELGEIVMMCRGLKHDQAPDYDTVRRKLIAMRDRKTASTVEKKTSNKKIDSPKRSSKKDTTAIVEDKKSSSKRKKIEVENDTDDDDDDDDDDDAIAISPTKSRRSSGRDVTGVEKVEKKASSSKEKANVSTISEGKKVSSKRKKTEKVERDIVDIVEVDLLISPTQGRRSSGRVANSVEKVVKKTLSFKVIAGPSKGVIFKQDSNTDDDFSSFKSRDIGRSGEFKKDDEMSEQHIVFLWNWDSNGNLDLNVQDKGSTNGTKINKGKIAKKAWCRLHDGDVVAVGATEIQVICK